MLRRLIDHGTKRQIFAKSRPGERNYAFQMINAGGPLARLRTRLRLLRFRHPTLGTYGLIGTNITIFGLYSAAPVPAPDMSWRFWPMGQTRPAAGFPSSWLPTKAFWERHFLASYRAVVRQGRLETLPLCTFMHADGMHLLFNMITLFFVGRQVEQIIGAGRFLIFYVASGTLAAAAQVGACGPQHSGVQCLGASGGVYANLAFLTCLMPWQTIYLYMVIPCPMWVMTAGLLALDIFYLRPGQGHEGHLCGATCGLAFWAFRYRPWR